MAVGRAPKQAIAGTTNSLLSTRIVTVAALFHCVAGMLHAGAPATVEASEGPKHKKNPAAGTKKILKLNKVGRLAPSITLSF